MDELVRQGIPVVAGVIAGLIGGVVLERVRESRDRRTTQREARIRAYQEFLAATNRLVLSPSSGAKARREAEPRLLDALAGVQLLGSYDALGMARRVVEAARTVIDATEAGEFREAIDRFGEERHQLLHFMRLDLSIDGESTKGHLRDHGLSTYRQNRDDEAKPSP